MTSQRLHGPLALASAALWLLAVICQLAGRPASNLLFSLLAAAAGVAAYFTGKRNERYLRDRLGVLEAEQAGRRLDANQREALVGAFLSIAKPAIPIHLIGLQGDKEAIHLANALKHILEAGGFAVDGVWEDSIIGGTGSGILIRQDTTDGVVGIALAAALQRVGLGVRIVGLGAARSEGQVEIIVGYRPPGTGRCRPTTESARRHGQQVPRIGIGVSEE